MILTDIAPDDMPAALDAVEAKLSDHPTALAAFRRIRATWPVTGGVDTPQQRADGVRLARAHGIATLDEPPSRAFMWDGRAIRTEVEATVIVHEVAHWLIASPERRGLPDFGLGPGPETTRRAEAEARRALDFEACVDEEQQASLLGILWEAELGHPAILAFLEQNWMEGFERPGAADFLVRHAERLRAAGLIGPDGRPTPPTGAAETALVSDTAAAHACLKDEKPTTGKGSATDNGRGPWQTGRASTAA